MLVVSRNVGAILLLNNGIRQWNEMEEVGFCYFVVGVLVCYKVWRFVCSNLAKHWS